MNLTQIVVENDCTGGQSDYSRSQMNYNERESDGDCKFQSGMSVHSRA